MFQRKNGSKREKVNQNVDKYLAQMNKANRQVNKVLNKRRDSEEKKFKVLLLGAGESGKTTVRKQLQLLHGVGYDTSQKKDYRRKIWSNLLEGMHAILEAQEKVGITIQDDNSLQASEIVAAEVKKLYESGLQYELTDELADALNVLWKDSDVQAIYEEQANFQLQESYKELADRLRKYPQWGGTDWIPEDEDILLCRTRTTGVVDSTYVLRDQTFRVIDVGGQRVERKKWFGLFEGVTGMIFVVAMSGYNQRIFEDNKTNRLEESLELWEQIANAKEFSKSAIILFLNKYDVFKVKYKEKNIPIEYDGKYLGISGPPPLAEDDNEACDKAKQWFRKLYVGLVDEEREKQLFVNVTTALDPRNMSKILNDCAIHILTTNMIKSGLVSD